MLILFVFPFVKVYDEALLRLASAPIGCTGGAGAEIGGGGGGGKGIEWTPISSMLFIGCICALAGGPVGGNGGGGGAVLEGLGGGRAGAEGAREGVELYLYGS